MEKGDEEKPEIVLCAAIWYNDGITYVHQPNNLSTGFVIGGWRHHNCINTYSAITGNKTRSVDIQGFITSRGRFVDRKEAMGLAKESGQVTKQQSFEELYSEDLY